MEFLNYGLRWLHILSAIVMVGGIFYVRFAVLPAAGVLNEAERTRLRAELRARWAKWIMASVGLLLLTGLVNMILVPRQNTFVPEDGRKLYSMLIGVKFLLALPVFFIVSTLNGRSGNADRFRQKEGLWLNIAVLLCVVIVCLAGYARYIPRLPKSDSAAEPQVGFHQPTQAMRPYPAVG